ncbi:MAG: iron dependent repressor, metal binding and dimerization domain protein [Planctomycetota bacterium]|nr:iron dependent repressor, metal binding and dimerization domain protein [Planctomycetota bacterium]
MNTQTLSAKNHHPSRQRLLLKMLLTEVLGVEPRQAEKDLEQISHQISSETTEKLARFLRFQNTFLREEASLPHGVTITS